MDILFFKTALIATFPAMGQACLGPAAAGFGLRQLAQLLR